MEKSRFPREYKVYLPLVGLFFLLVFMLPKSPKFGYDYKKGSPWLYEDLVSQFDFPLIKSEEQYKAEVQQAGSLTIPVYRYDSSVGQGYMEQLATMDMGEFDFLKPSLNESLRSVYSKGVLPKATEGILYVQKDMRASKVPSSELFTVASAGAFIKQSLVEQCPEKEIDSLYSSFVAALVQPDMIFDQQMTDAIHEQSIGVISPTRGVIKAGQTIVSNGELVTAEIEQVLDSYKAEYDRSVGYDGPTFLQWLGNVLIALAIVVILFFAIYFCNYHIFESYNKYLYVLLIFVISAVASFVVAQTQPEYFYMVPYTLIVLYLLAFFSRRLVFIVYFISLLPILIAAPEGVELFFIYFSGGVVAISIFDYFNRGWLQFVSAFITFAVMAMVWIGFRVADGGLISDWRPLLYLMVAAFLSVAGYPLIYLFEKIFMLVSSSKLVELSDTSKPLLRMLADKAPGTFQHSLQVMNIADAVARAIDANVPLIRAAALYHDIGKILNPQCFTENETPGVKYHEGLSAKESAQEIIRHVSDGLSLAEKYGLPDIIKQFIVSHHGTTCAAFFLNKYLSEGGDPEDVAAFYYDGVRPVTKEQVILMLCDAVEAASRSLKKYTPESISELVDRIIDGKADDGQLSDSNISLREVNMVKQVMKSYLQQMYHSRVAYPKRDMKA